jgi:putative Ca2+/H+ antiporter (TMEM165/GDT1 family)
VILESFLISTAAVAIAEIGDKTQLFALVLALRYHRPWAVSVGILLATIANHLLAGSVGAWAASQIPADWMRWGVGLSFIALALWTLVPDKIDEDGDKPPRFGPFLASLFGFFLLEMGDKTQVATIMLAAELKPFAGVMAGSILGMMLVNLPVVFAGRMIGQKIPLALTRKLAALLFAALGVVTLLW